jgi:hypothetical protein
LRRAPRELFEIDVLVGSQQVAARLIVAPLPPDKAGERRQRVRQNAKKHGRTPTVKSLARCDWTLLLTNVLAAQLPTSTVLEVYTVRWQVELAFKLFKSDLHLDETTATEPLRVQCEFYAKLIALLLFNRLTGVAENWLGEKISATKLFRRMRGDLNGWLRTLGKGQAAATREWLTFLADYIKPSVRKARSTLLRLRALTGTVRQRTLLDPLGFLQAKLKNAATGCATFKHHLRDQQLSFQADAGGFQRTASPSLP